MKYGEDLKTKELDFDYVSARLNKIEYKRIFPCNNEQRMMKYIIVSSRLEIFRYRGRLIYSEQNDSALKKKNNLKTDVKPCEQKEA